MIYATSLWIHTHINTFAAIRIRIIAPKCVHQGREEFIVTPIVFKMDYNA